MLRQVRRRHTPLQYVHGLLIIPARHKINYPKCQSHTKTSQCPTIWRACQQLAYPGEHTKYSQSHLRKQPRKRLKSRTSTCRFNRTSARVVCPRNAKYIDVALPKYSLTRRNGWALGSTHPRRESNSCSVSRPRPAAKQSWLHTAEESICVGRAHRQLAPCHTTGGAAL